MAHVMEPALGAAVDVQTSWVSDVIGPARFAEMAVSGQAILIAVIEINNYSLLCCR
jgi:hypothetical protein